MGGAELPEGFPDDISVIDGDIVMSMGAGFTKEDGSEMLGSNTTALSRGDQTVILSARGTGGAVMLSTVSLE